LEARIRKDGRTVKKVLCLVLTCAFALTLIGCGSDSPKSTPPKGGGTTGAPAPDAKKPGDGK
jgi:hypothetical protein